MRMERRRAWCIYAAGMAGMLAGAWLTQITGSMVPLALGASALLLCTASVVSVLFAKQPAVRRSERR